VTFRVKYHEHIFIYYIQLDIAISVFAVLYVMLSISGGIPRDCVSQALYFKIIFEKRIPC
jgi:hypothetical protein